MSVFLGAPDEAAWVHQTVARILNMTLEDTYLLCRKILFELTS